MTNDQDNSNTGLTRENLEKEISTFGRAFGLGQNSRPAMAQRCVEAAHKLANVGPDDAKDLYTKFQQAAAKTKGVEYAADKSFSVQASKLKQFLSLGAAREIDGIRVMNDAVDVIQECVRMAENPLAGSAYDNMVKVARKQLLSPKKQLTMDEIRGIMTEKPADKDNLERVMDAYRSIYKLAERLTKDGIDATNVSVAVEALGDQIEDMNGEVPSMAESDKKKERALKTLKDLGVNVEVIPTNVVSLAALTVNNNEPETSDETETDMQDADTLGASIAAE